MQDKVKINGAVIWQPDADMKYRFATTYTDDSTRVQSGEGHFTPMFTTEQYGYEASDIPVAQAASILQAVIGKTFVLHCFSPYYGIWKDITCYVGEGDLNIGTLKSGGEKLSSLSFNATGVNPL
nr:MAG TPA: hypothetical protein [Caudoviricetes sp.]